tara:strand:- start:738 stop:962 length:225 start_codon:yes stop_codon:yes gene_type:complete
MEVFSDNKGATKAVVKFDYKGYLFSLTSFTPEPELGVFRKYGDNQIDWEELYRTTATVEGIVAAKDFIDSKEEQ